MAMAQFHKELDICDFACRISMDPKTIRTRLQELAFLNSKATIWFKASSGRQASANGNGAALGISPEEDWEELHYSGGLREYVQHLNKDNSPMHEPIFIQDEVRPIAPFTTDHNMLFNSFCSVLTMCDAPQLPSTAACPKEIPKFVIGVAGI